MTFVPAKSPRCPWPTWFVRDAIPTYGLSSSEVTVFVVIFDHAGADRRAWPSQRTIATITGLSRSTIQRALERLERFRLLRVTPGTGRGVPSTYEIPKAMPKPMRNMFLPTPTRRDLSQRRVEGA